MKQVTAFFSNVCIGNAKQFIALVVVATAVHTTTTFAQYNRGHEQGPVNRGQEQRASNRQQYPGRDRGIPGNRLQAPAITGRASPIQRFRSLKQLSSTPQGLQAMPVSVIGANISAAALGDNGKGICAIHLVNNGTARQVTFSGIPAAIKSLRMLITDKKRPMEEGTAIPVVNGKAKFVLTETSFTTLLSK